MANYFTDINLNRKFSEKGEYDLVCIIYGRKRVQVNRKIFFALALSSQQIKKN